MSQYIRYTDDGIILHRDPSALKAVLAPIDEWLLRERRLHLHPQKVEIRRLSQGFDFLGYITLPHHRVLRMKTKKRMLKRVNDANVTSYLGMLNHCQGYNLRQSILGQMHDGDNS